MRSIRYLLLCLALPHLLNAQSDIPLLLPGERRVVESQAEAFNQAITPALTDAAKSTVRVWSGSRRLAYGTVVGDGSRILTKWSEVANATDKLRVDDGNEGRAVKLIGVYEAEDLAVLQIQGLPLKPVSWSTESPKLGNFLAAPQPDGRLAAWGVVSVLERNLRDTDLAYLGVTGALGYAGQGVKIAEVAKDSGAAAAGLRPGQIILKVAERSISGLLELKNALIGTVPGTTIPLTIEEKGKQTQVDVLLGNRPKMEQMFGARLQQMERMGGPISQVRSAFTRVIQTDMRPKPNQIGGPVVDLQGRVVGITMARADRTRSFIMPSAAVIKLLEQPTVDPAVAEVRSDEIKNAPRLATRGAAPQQRPDRGGEERSLRHLTDIERLRNHLRREMDALERGR
ncbi:MAG: PDZ domain-containing protein [Akkermansiaceae bacterium]